MVFDLVAGAKQRFTPPARGLDPLRQPRVLVFDSGLGGVSVFPDVRRLARSADLIYAADDAVFPYGRLSETALIERVVAVMTMLIDVHDPDVVVVACHTASTLVLGPLRERWPSLAFVGTVPAIKPAVAASTSKLISVLATPGTVARAYTRDLIETYAQGCHVTLVGAVGLAALAERIMRGDEVDDAAVLAEVRAAFVTDGDRRTDVVVLACTHYPLLLSRLGLIAPWPVTWIDPAPAIARRVERVLDDRFGSGRVAGETAAAPAPAFFTGNTPPSPALHAFLHSQGLLFQASPAMASLGRYGR